MTLLLLMLGQLADNAAPLAPVAPQKPSCFVWVSKTDADGTTRHICQPIPGECLIVEPADERGRHRWTHGRETGRGFYDIGDAPDVSTARQRVQDSYLRCCHRGHLKNLDAVAQRDPRELM